MQKASVAATADAPSALRLLHRENVTRAPWGGPAARVRNGDEKSRVVLALRHDRA
jgi:hypothetical protein